MKNAPKPPPELDEKWVVEWFEFGWKQLVEFLELHAKYERYCSRHHRPAE